MIRFFKRSLIFILIFYGIFYYIFQIDYFSFNNFKLGDFKKENYFEKLFSFLKERNYKNAFVLRDGEFLTYSNLNIRHIADDKTIDFMYNVNKIYYLDCIISNHYNDPIFYKTKLNDIVNQYHKSELVFDDLGYKVFELNKNNNKINSEYFNFNFNVSEIDFLKDRYLYLTHKNEYPSLLSKPDIQYGEFPILENGIYDCICDIEIIAEEDSIISFSILNYESYGNGYIVKDTLYLKKGKNNISTRFLTTNKPFRCLFSSKRYPVSIKNFKINFYKKENEFYDLNQIYPKTYSMIFDNNNNIKSNALLFFKNKYKNTNSINIDLFGDGEVFLSTLKLNGINKFLLKNCFNNFLIKILLFFNGDSSVLSIGQKSKIIEKNIPPNSILFLQFKKNHMNENAKFIIKDIKIINGT
ncbi:MAG: hypothetical protein Q8K37_01565 [Alphaproteobacteria bacterium]|nr:hypothetical protein [Alphaproteobacteria bacterium]